MQPKSVRKESNEAAVKVLEILQEDHAFFASLCLTGGLRSMSTKQFFCVVDYFLQNVTGKPLKTLKDDPSNEIIDLLTKTRCPYLVTKSNLKAPTAPHAFESSINLLVWLSEFGNPRRNTPQRAQELEDKYNLIVADESLPSQEFTKLFHKTVRDGFHLWNDGKDVEYTAMVRDIINKNVSAHMRGQIKTKDELKKKIKDTRAACAELKKFDCKIKNEKKCKAVQEKCLELETAKLGLDHRCTAISDDLGAVEVKWATKCHQMEQKQASVDHLKAVIAGQSHTANDMEKLKMDVQTLEYQTRKEREASDRIKDGANQQKITLARLLQTKTDMVIQLNEHLTELVKEIKRTDLVRTCGNAELQFEYLTSKVSMKEIAAIGDRLKRLDRLARESLKTLEDDQETAESQLKRTNLQLSGLKETEAIVKVKYDESKTVLENVEEKLFKINQKKNTDIDRVRELIRQAQFRVADIERTTKEKAAHTDNLEQHTKGVNERCTSLAHKNMALKDAIIAKQDECLEYIEGLKRRNLAPTRRRQLEEQRIQELSDFIKAVRLEMENNVKKVVELNKSLRPQI